MNANEQNVDGQAQEGAIAGELIKRIISRNTI